MYKKSVYAVFIAFVINSVSYKFASSLVSVLHLPAVLPMVTCWLFPGYFVSNNWTGKDHLKPNSSPYRTPLGYAERTRCASGVLMLFLLIGCTSRVMSRMPALLPLFMGFSHAKPCALRSDKPSHTVAHGHTHWLCMAWIRCVVAHI